MFAQKISQEQLFEQNLGNHALKINGTKITAKSRLQGVILLPSCPFTVNRDYTADFGVLSTRSDRPKEGNDRMD